MRPAPGKSGTPSENRTMLSGASTRFCRLMCTAVRSKKELKSVTGSSSGNHARRSASICAGVFPPRSWIGWKLFGCPTCSPPSEPTNTSVARFKPPSARSEEHTSELQSQSHISYAVFCLKKKKKTTTINTNDLNKKIKEIDK